MRKVLLSLAAVALMMSACTQDVTEPMDGGIANLGGNVGVTATADGTRTSMTENEDGSLTVAWVAGDAIGLSAEDATSTLGSNVKYTAINSATSTNFKCEEAENVIKWGEGEHNFYAYYPYTAEGDDYSAVPASVPAVQVQSAAGNTDHLQPYAFLYAPLTTNMTANQCIDLKFKNAFSILELQVCTEAGNVACESLIFKAMDENEIVAAEGVKVNLADGSLDFSAATTSNKIQVNLGQSIVLTQDEAQKFYMVVTPGHAGKQFQAIAVVGGQEIVLGEFGVPESGIPAGRKAILALNIPEQEEVVVDLSANGTANTYIANAAGTKFKFNATVKGNGYDPITGAPAEAIDLTDAKAYIIWAYKKTTSDGADNTKLNLSVLRESVKIEGDYITFETPANMQDGNLAIAVADANDNIMWSWHIWAVQGYNYETSAIDVTTHGMSYKIMDRNLGAFCNPGALASPTEDDYAFASGMYYQWGRKDPFLCGGTQRSAGTWFDFIKNGQLVKGPTFTTVGDAAYQYSEMIKPHGLTDLNEILTASVQNPLQFFTGSNWATSAATSNGQEDDWGKLWGNQKDNSATSVKTMYDPCPVGYTVASPDHFKFVASTGSRHQLTTYPTWECNTPDLPTEGVDRLSNAPWGMYFYTKGVRTQDGGEPEDKTTVFLPKQRWVQNNGSVKDNGSICLYTNAPSTESAWGGQPYKANIEFQGYADLDRPSWFGAAEAACAFAVRCVSENGDTTPTPPTPPTPTDNAIDLSENGTANCYVVNKADTEYKFNATVKGNGVATLSGDTETTIAPTKARLLWAQNQTTTNPVTIGFPVEYGATNADNLVVPSSVTLDEDGYIRFKTGADMPNGNVGIVATDDNDNVLWSWHLWVVNGYDPAATDINVTTKDVNTYFMDRNIGAFCNYATVENPDNNDHIASRGLYYQWGRKDPFIGHQSADGYATKAKIYDASGVGVAKYACYGNDAVMMGVDPADAANSDDINDIVAWTVANPNKFVKGVSANGYTWVATTKSIKADTDIEWTKLWGNPAIGESLFDKGGVKTMYDPCPAGYRVPSTGHFIFITSHGDQSSSGYGNPLRNWQFNSVEKIYDESGAAYGKVEKGTGVNWAKEAPFGLHFYANGVKTASPDAQSGVQDYGVLPADQESLIYFPAQGWIPYGFGCGNNGNELQYQTNRPAKNNINCYRMMCSNDGNFYYGWTSVNYGQAMGLPVRCVRE